jgi:hypothetical protein
MHLLAWSFVGAALLGPAAPAPNVEARLAELAAAVLSADYRGDRAALARLDGELGALPESALSDYRDYWRGFGRWRRAMNGFNETPTPTDLQDDLEKAVARFQASLVRRPDWIEARLALVGCWGNLIFVAGNDAEKRKAFIDEAVPAYRWLRENGRDNPRALWIIGGMEFSAPPPHGGDLDRAAATLRRGLELSWREATSGPPPPAWVPTWGGPENLMNLAWMYSHLGTLNRTAALAYAEGALTAVPEWHYVRNVLLPQIEALPTAAGR